MNHISKLPQVQLSIFSKMTALANKHKAINLSQGFPNFKSDSALIDLVSHAMRSGYNQYAPMPGILALREAIANKLEFLYNSTYNSDTEITITSGATQAIYSIISAFIKQNDEVIIFKPAYDSYEPTTQLNGGIVMPIQLEAPNYKINWELVQQQINDNTKMMIINTPQNPSATIFSKQDMLQLQEITKGTDIIVLSDEVYEHIIFDNEKHQSICLFPDLKSRSFLVASFGKTFHNTGWKIGYCCAPKVLMEEFRKAHQFTVFSVNHPIQIALAEYLQEPNHYLKISQFYQNKRNLFTELLEGSRFKILPTQGTYFMLLDYSNITTEKDTDFAERLTIEHGIASIPLSVFNENNLDQNVLRFCFAKTDNTLKKATEILKKI
ncbi:methionine aminotransferase [Yeosuana sp. MJ-SS3]|uniref:Methionine aminotransferase n=1 Tax=Gilvirhabdus luticola TaxID=3079858 RepID=A0ABU3U468_9FLAO|nr:methionine aminotransferase [Yeosuana sp. MJ-SS3]MDU8884895.1 methionine aminotransferase [Yeosuana sp. MJ-SS3]